MFRRSKYIVGELLGTATGMVGAVVFDEAVDHALMARQCLADAEALSAGFVSLSVNRETGEVEVELWGESKSLKLAANPAHASMVRRTLGLPRR